MRSADTPKRDPDRHGHSSSSSEEPTRAFPAKGAEASSDPDPTLAPGQLLCERFRIVRFIAHGGMGQVYEARDLELGQAVAIKTIRPSLSRDHHAMKRFRREIQLSRRITHPNVCRVFDLFQCTDPKSGETTSFLTMELLEGETLAATLERDERMSAGDAERIVEQIVAALEAAHAASVVHRDFKPENVLLVHAPHGPRVVVTDFGLAQEQSPLRDERALTESGYVIGTLAYMAPEQLEGHEASTASDIYALGLVMYEMLTGARPFTGDTPVTLAANRLRDNPSSPRVYVPNLDRKWEATILRCLERDPSRRFASVAQVATSLKRRGRIAPRLRAPLGAVGAGLVATALFFATGTRLPRDERVATAPARRSVAVLGFENLSQRADVSWLSTALAETLSTELGSGERIRVVPGELVARAKTNLSLTDDRSYAPDTLARIKEQLSTDYVLLGSYIAVTDSDTEREHIRVDVRVQATDSGETIVSLSKAGTEIELFDLVANVGNGVREGLGIETGTGTRLRGSGEQPAPTREGLDAIRHYARGLAQWRAFDYEDARASLARAVATDPRHARAHRALAELLSELGERDAALDTAEKALALSDTLPREERLGIEALYWSLRDGSEQEIEKRRALVSLFPDDIDHRLALVRSLAGAGFVEEAFATLDAISEGHGRPEVLVTEAVVARRASRFPRQLDSARRAATRARAIGDLISLAEARIVEASAPREWLTRSDALQALGEARGIYHDLGDSLKEASVLRLEEGVEAQRVEE